MTTSVYDCNACERDYCAGCPIEACPPAATRLQVEVYAIRIDGATEQVCAETCWDESGALVRSTRSYAGPVKAGFVAASLRTVASI